MLDLHTASAQLGGNAPVDAAQLAEQLQLLVQDAEGTSPLRDAEVSSGLDPQAGVQMLLADGRVTPVRAGSAAAKAVRRLPRAKVAANPLGAAGKITLYLTVATLLAVCAVPLVRRQASLARYGSVARDEDEPPVVSVRRVPSRVR